MDDEFLEYYINGGFSNEVKLIALNNYLLLNQMNMLNEGMSSIITELKEIKENK